jgi:alkaline phosphatase
MLKAGYDFYAGGDVNGSSKNRTIVYDKAKEMGYTISRGYNDFCTKAGSAEKMMLFQEKVATELPYAINRTKDDLTLAQITAAGIEFLREKSKKGFFMMIEGGKIDYAAHNDDGATVFHEVQDLGAAVAVAYEFYKEHKDETLIIVTADHETGGLVLGYRSDYTLNLKALASQKVSVERMIEILEAEKKTTWSRIEELVKENIGVGLRNRKTSEETVSMNHDLAKEIAYNAVYDLNRSASLSWASGNHSGTFVPLFAIGKGAEMFNGVIDNTDIPNIIRRLKGIK